MKIKIAKKKFLFDNLNKGHELEEIQKEEDSWKESEKDPDVEKLKKETGYVFPCIELPYPLDSVSLHSVRMDSFYSSLARLNFREYFALKGLSKEILEEELVEGLRFYPSTENGTGYFIDKNNHLRISIMEMNIKDSPYFTISIGLGCNGARVRSFKDYRSFSSSMNELEYALNVIVKAAYKPMIKAEKVILPDTTLYLTP